MLNFWETISRIIQLFHPEWLQTHLVFCKVSLKRMNVNPASYSHISPRNGGYCQIARKTLILFAGNFVPSQGGKLVEMFPVPSSPILLPLPGCSKRLLILSQLFVGSI